MVGVYVCRIVILDLPSSTFLQDLVPSLYLLSICSSPSILGYIVVAPIPHNYPSI